MGRMIFFLGEAYRALRRNAAPSIAAIVTIAVTVLLVGVLVPVLDASGSKTDDVRDQITLEAYLFKDAPQQEVDALGKRIAAIPHVASVDYVTQQEALEILRKNLDEKQDILGALNGHNPLPPSYKIQLDDPDNLESVQNALEPPGASGNPQPISAAIDEIKAPDESETIRSVTGALKWLLVAIAVLLGLSSLFLVINTIRLSIYARRREVEVMQLVGATNWFIRWPFVIEGLVVGLAGAGVAIGILWVGKLIVNPLSSDFALVDNLDTIAFGPLVAGLLAGSMAVAALGSGITLRRFLRI